MLTAVVLLAGVVTVLVLAGVGACLWCHVAANDLKALLGKFALSLARRLREREENLPHSGDPRPAADRRGDLLAWIIGLFGVAIGSIFILANFNTFRENFRVVYSYDPLTAGILALTLALAVAMVALGMKGLRALGCRGLKLCLANAFLALTLVAVVLYQAALTFDRVRTTKEMSAPRVAAAPVMPAGGRLRIAGAYDAAASLPSPAAETAIALRAELSDYVEAALPALIIVGEFIAWLFGATFLLLTCLFIARLPERINRRAAHALLLFLPDDPQACVEGAVDAAAAVGSRVATILRRCDPLHRIRAQIEQTRLQTELAGEEDRLFETRRPHEAAELEARLKRWVREHETRLSAEKATHEQLLELNRQNADLERQIDQQRAEAELEMGRARLDFNKGRADMDRENQRLDLQLTATADQLQRQEREAQARFERESARAEQGAALIALVSEKMLRLLEGVPERMRDTLEREFAARIQRELAASESFADLLVRMIAIYTGFREMALQMASDAKKAPSTIPTGVTGGVESV